MDKIKFIVFSLILVSCTSNTIYEMPKNLIPKDTMVSLLTDMLIASSAKNVKNKNLQNKVNYMPLVYNKYKIDSTRFNSSNVYYTSVIEEYNELLLKVKSGLKKKEKIYIDSIKIIDSIKNIDKKKNQGQNKKIIEKQKKKPKSLEKISTELKIDSSLIKSKDKIKTKTFLRDRN